MQTLLPKRMFLFLQIKNWEIFIFSNQENNFQLCTMWMYLKTNILNGNSNLCQLRDTPAKKQRTTVITQNYKFLHIIFCTIIIVQIVVSTNLRLEKKGLPSSENSISADQKPVVAQVAVINYSYLCILSKKTLFSQKQIIYRVQF